jgi:hypothetical protein
MPASELKSMLNRTNEIELIVTGRKSGREISRPVWFVYEGNMLYLLPVQGSDTEWYKNVQKNPNMKISVDGQEITGKARPITRRQEILYKIRCMCGTCFAVTIICLRLIT